MRYMIREKFFHLGEDSTIMNEAGQSVFEVDGKVLSLHDRLIVRDLAGNEVVNVHRRLLTLRPTYEITRGGETLATFRKHFFSPFVDRFTVDILEEGHLLRQVKMSEEVSLDLLLMARWLEQ